VGILCAGVLMATSFGCLVSSDTSQTRSGNYVPDNTFDKIEPGKTTQAWVKAVLGEPSNKSTADGTEIWKWTYTERKESSGAIFLIFGGHDEKEQSHAAYVELKDGVVVNKWRG
jgi:outer membrane protein assembly factor BamE (lipoprotein component of BamABCDE complex)